MKKRKVMAGILGLASVVDIGYTIEYHITEHRQALRKEIEAANTPGMQHERHIHNEIVDLGRAIEDEPFNEGYLAQFTSLRNEYCRLKNDPEYIEQFKAYSEAQNEAKKTEFVFMGLLFPGLIAGVAAYKMAAKKQQKE